MTAQQWNRLPQDVVQFPSLEFFETQWGKALSNKAGPLHWPCIEQEVGRGRSWGPFQDEFSCDSMIVLNEKQRKWVKS